MNLLAAYPDRVLAHDVDGYTTAFEGDVQCLDAGPAGIYCGTDDGVYRTTQTAQWHSDDAWTHVAALGDVTAVAVADEGVWAGTAPSAVYYAPDGEEFEERPGLEDIPSSDTWAFPPRPRPTTCAGSNLRASASTSPSRRARCSARPTAGRRGRTASPPARGTPTG